MAETANFARLFDYDNWANAAHLDSLRKAGSPPASALKAFAHVVATRRIWLKRLDARYATDLKFYPALDVAGCAALMAEEQALWKELLAGLDDQALDATRSFKDSLGNPYTMRVRDMLMHVLLHSAHHRGQVALELRQAGFTPADADLYISPMARPA
ncbi:MAG: DinB family protein [Planctomycetes bacterium]|nr:DinB family protein [Planctomycetota bacterium]